MHDEKERMLRCPDCGNMIYPKIAPAVIVAVLDGERILMTKYAGRAYKKYALIAGFLEAGESVEEAVQREVMEEVGIEVKDIEYFGSQSWPFPNSLMIGCICKYKSGEIKVDENEITKAKWFKKEEIEQPPSNVSIFSRLLKNFKENY